MTAQTRSVLYSYFNAGDRPTEGEFADLIDSSLNLATTSAQVIESDVSCAGTFDVSGAFTVKNASTTSLTGDVNITGNLTVSGISTLGTLSSLSIANVSADTIFVSGLSTLNALSVVNSAAGIFTGNVTINGLTTVTGGIAGISTDAAIGNVGEIITAVASDASVELVTNTPKTITSLALQAGNWNLFGAIRFTADAATTISSITGGLSGGDNTIGLTGNIFSLSTTFSTGSSLVSPIPVTPIVVSASTNYFLTAQCSFAVSGMNVGGVITARRVI